MIFIGHEDMNADAHESICNSFGNFCKSNRNQEPAFLWTLSSIETHTDISLECKLISLKTYASTIIMNAFDNSMRYVLNEWRI